MWALISGKEINSHIHIISFISAIILFIAIAIYNYKKGRPDKYNYKALIAYWFITIAIMTCGVIIHVVIWIILQHGISALTLRHYNDFIGFLIIFLMTFSFPGLLIALLTINEPGYLNNFSRIFITGIIFIFIPDIIHYITIDNVPQTNEVFYGVINDLVGIFLLGLLLSLIITKLNITIFKQEKRDKLQIEYYFIVSIVFSLVLLLLFYLFFLNQLPSNITIKLTDWKVITLHSTDRILKYDNFSPGKMIDLPKYQKEGDIYLVGPLGNMQINSVNYNLDPADIILIIQASRIHIDKNKKDQLVIDTISRMINIKNRVIPLTIWSTVSAGQKTTIIAGIFLIASTIIGSIANIYIKIKKGTL